MRYQISRGYHEKSFQKRMDFVAEWRLRQSPAIGKNCTFAIDPEIYLSFPPANHQKTHPSFCSWWFVGKIGHFSPKRNKGSGDRVTGGEAQLEERAGGKALNMRGVIETKQGLQTASDLLLEAGVRSESLGAPHLCRLTQSRTYVTRCPDCLRNAFFVLSSYSFSHRCRILSQPASLLNP